MDRLLTILLALALLLYSPGTAYAPIAEPPEPVIEYQEPEPEPEPPTETYIATAYILSDGNGDGVTATGTVPSRGRTIAVDPRQIPYGSHVYIDGQGPYVAEDTGGDMRGKRLDIYFGDGKQAYREAINFGRREVQVRIERGEGE
jgi:3D (Asp-Asp-Asp) domain-containing protein